MMTFEQFVTWKEIADEDIEFADEVLRYIRNLELPLADSEPPKMGIAFSAKFGRADEVAQRISGVV